MSIFNAFPPIVARAAMLPLPDALVRIAGCDETDAAHGDPRPISVTQSIVRARYWLKHPEAAAIGAGPAHALAAASLLARAKKTSVLGDVGGGAAYPALLREATRLAKRSGDDACIKQISRTIPVLLATRVEACLERGVVDDASLEALAATSAAQDAEAQCDELGELSSASAGGPDLTPEDYGRLAQALVQHVAPMLESATLSARFDSLIGSRLLQDCSEWDAYNAEVSAFRTAADNVFTTLAWAAWCATQGDPCATDGASAIRCALENVAEALESCVDRQRAATHTAAAKEREAIDQRATLMATWLANHIAAWIDYAGPAETVARGVEKRLRRLASTDVTTANML